MSAQLHSAGDIVGDRYKITAFVGEGGMQQVYEAMDLLPDRRVALKAPKNLSASNRFNRHAPRPGHFNVHRPGGLITLTGTQDL
jgi:eukaryotic-like serine/threonine-protein kinase